MIRKTRIRCGSENTSSATYIPAPGSPDIGIEDHQRHHILGRSFNGVNLDSVMHNTILLALWASVSFVLYKVIASILTERHHRNAAKKLGCEPAHQFKGFDIQGIRNVMRIIKADKESRVPDFLKARVDDACALEGKNITTFDQNLLGARGFFTIDPKNVQAVLATQFKDFGLGERRNGNFAPLLGHGIVSVPILPTTREHICVVSVLIPLIVLYRWRGMAAC
jgi:hypothetical protein